MLTSMHTQVLNQLLDIVKELTADSQTTDHQSLVGDVGNAVAKIERLIVTARRSSLVQHVTKMLDQREQDIREILESPLEALYSLAENESLGNTEKTKLLFQLAWMHELLTQWNVALDRFNRALKYCKGDRETKARILKRMGRIQSKRGNHKEAAHLLHDSLTLFTELENAYEIAQLHINIGWNDFQSNDHQSAEKNYHIALGISQDTTGAERIVADARMNLAILETVKGNFALALAHYRRTLVPYTALRDMRGLAMAYYNMGLLYMDMKDWEQAGESYQKSLELAQGQNLLHLLGHIHLSYAELALQLGDLELAESCSQHAVKVFGGLNSGSQLSEAYKYGGQVQYRKKNWDESQRLFEKSIQIAHSSQSHLNEAEARYEYGLMLLDKPTEDAEFAARFRVRAKVQFNRALQLFTELGAKADSQKTELAIKRIEDIFLKRLTESEVAETKALFTQLKSA